MSRIERTAVVANTSLMWKAAIPALALASLAACAQAPATRGDALAAVDAGKTASILKTNTCARPEYPQDARRRGSQGATTVRFLIDTDGSVAQSAIIKSSGDPSLDEAARAALAKCRFKPAVKDGAPQRAWMPVHYVWSMAPANKPQAPPATSAAAY